MNRLGFVNLSVLGEDSFVTVAECFDEEEKKFR